MKRKSENTEIKKVRRGQRKTFTQLDKMAILTLYHKEGMPQEQIAEHFGTTRQNINKIIQKMKKNVEVLKDGIMVYNSDEVLKRRELNAFERQKLINLDAIEIMELSLSMTKHKLNTIIQSVAAGGEFGVLGIDIDQLSKIMNTALPYVLPKSEAKKSKMPTGDVKTPQMKLHKLMKMN